MNDKKPKKPQRKNKHPLLATSGKTIVQKIDDALRETETVSFNGEPRELTRLAAITHQLAEKMGAGNKLARKVLCKYDAYARQTEPQKVQVIVTSEEDGRIIGPIETYKKEKKDE